MIGVWKLSIVVGSRVKILSASYFAKNLNYAGMQLNKTCLKTYVDV